MKKCLIIFLAVIAQSLSALADQAAQFVIAADYAKTGTITINGKSVPGEIVLKELSRTIESQGKDAPIMVILPKSLRFEDWNNVRGLMDKVGFMNVRYFVKWSSTQKMIELKQVGEAIDSF